MSTHDEALRAAHSLADWFNAVAADLATLADGVGGTMEGNLARRAGGEGRLFAGLEPLSRGFLDTHAFAVGAGALFAEESTETGGRALEWWSRGGDGTIARLSFDLTPDSDRFYDYVKLPFFSSAASTGRQTLWGPYVDYLGFEDYILTFTAPFHVHGRFAGVAGCDVRLKDIEQIFLPILRRIPGKAALLNASNRVIFGNSGAHLTGERIKPGHGDTVPVDVPDLGLTVLLTP